jgi:uncharacterized protein YpmB
MPIAESIKDNKGNIIEVKETGEYGGIKINSFIDYYHCFGIEYDEDNMIVSITPPEHAVMKYLDKEDIEANNFSLEIVSDEQLDNKMAFGDAVLVAGLRKNHLIWYITYFQGENNLIIKVYNKETMKQFEPENTMFNGTIKNKHELEVILKQIGVN